MIQIINIGDYCKLLNSNNPYVPKGSVLKIESLTTIVDDNGNCKVFNVSWKGNKYSVHRDVIQKINQITPEKVLFT